MDKNTNIPWSISEEEATQARMYLARTLELGADAVRISLSKSMMDLVGIRDGSPDKVTRSGDRQLILSIFKGGRYASFSTNRPAPEVMEGFIREAVEAVDMFAPDPFRRLPDPGRLCCDAVTGLECGLYDKAYAGITPQQRMSEALAASHWGRWGDIPCKVISEEMEYSDSISDLLVLDSNGLEARHIESSFEIGCEYTVEDPSGAKYSGYWWDCSARKGEVDYASVCPEALRKASAQIGAGSVPSGTYTMVVDTEVAGKLLGPLLGALGGYSLQQQNSFLVDCLGKKVFGEGFTLTDGAREKGVSGARFFDSEGVATASDTVISEGIVGKYFLNTYIAGKMGLSPTVEECIKPVVKPWWGFGGRRETIGREDILSACGEGILVTGFNGGNCNSATGDFSYGVEGFAFKGGELRPIHGMVATGNMRELWCRLLAAGTDARPCRVRQVPTLAFEGVYFSA